MGFDEDHGSGQRVSATKPELTSEEEYAQAGLPWHGRPDPVVRGSRGSPGNNSLIDTIRPIGSFHECPRHPPRRSSAPCVPASG